MTTTSVAAPTGAAQRNIMRANRVYTSPTDHVRLRQRQAEQKLMNQLQHPAPSATFPRFERGAMHQWDQGPVDRMQRVLRPRC